MSKPKVLVIGSNSFSGSYSWLKHSEAGHSVWGVSRSTEPHSVFLPYRWPIGGEGNRLLQLRTSTFKALISTAN